jgi:hypothetical protein
MGILQDGIQTVKVVKIETTPSMNAQYLDHRGGWLARQGWLYPPVGSKGWISLVGYVYRPVPN